MTGGASALFIGFGAAVFGLILELIYRNGIGSVAAALEARVRELARDHAATPKFDFDSGVRPLVVAYNRDGASGRTGETVARAGITPDEHGWMIEMAKEHGVAFFVRPRPEDAAALCAEVARLPRLRGMIEKTLKGEVLPREALAGRDKVKKREREFRFPTHITFDNEGSEIYTIIEVDTRDRPGLLYDLTRTLAANNIYIASAVIATFGAQVVDAFYVKDMFGLKLHAKHRQEALDKKLRQAIAEGAERAQNAS